MKNTAFVDKRHVKKDIKKYPSIFGKTFKIIWSFKAETDI